MTIKYFILSISLALSATFGAWVLFSCNPDLLPRQVDLIQYWSGAKLFSTGGNPYNEIEMRAAQAASAFPEGTIRLWNPPVIFPLISPLAFLEFSTARLLWFLWGVFVVTSMILLLLINYRCHTLRPSVRVPLYCAILTFVPISETLGWGQTGSILLISSVGWWVLFQGAGLNSLGAGLMLSLSTIKPHLLAPLYVALFLMSIQRRRFKLLIGFGVGIALWAGIAHLVRHDIWSLYLAAMANPPIHWRTPNLGSVLQGVSGVHSMWVRNAPLFGSILLMIALFLVKSTRVLFNETQAVLLLLPFCLLVSPYGWLYDQILLLPFFFELAHQAARRHEPCLALVVCALSSVAMILCMPASLGQEIGLLPLAVYCVVAGASLRRLYRERSNRVAP